MRRTTPASTTSTATSRARRGRSTPPLAASRPTAPYTCGYVNDARFGACRFADGHCTQIGDPSGRAERHAGSLVPRAGRHPGSRPVMRRVERRAAEFRDLQRLLRVSAGHHPGGRLHGGGAGHRPPRPPLSHDRPDGCGHRLDHEGAAGGNAVDGDRELFLRPSPRAAGARVAGAVAAGRDRRSSTARASPRSASCRTT